MNSLNWLRAFNELLLPQILRGAGFQFLWTGNQYLTMSLIPQKGVQNASAMFNLILRLGAAISISTANSFLHKWQTSFYSHISQTLPIGRLKLFDTDKLNSLYGDINASLSYMNDYQSLLLLHFYGKREGFIMAFNNLNYYTMWVAIIPIILLPFIKDDSAKMKDA